ncbi:VWA domain-containing protein [Lysobacter solisilvae (ex Woo and Kim 2020)]|uniref:VWA domain-containing protein n=1 Tax=Agrilutibacter terrestris TaxID=2865112 RepID=A0A7H0FUR2_9GAMM|nr:VWA domain-containing protein [Lysobacter terrestris]QNP39778.1 VWA domain-containing protein [Lysobacter terrestris]
MNPLGEFAALHFLRPWWLLALVALPLLAWWWRRRQRRNSAWQQLVDPHLLPHLLDAHGDRRSALGAWMAACAYVLAILALAGPAWRQSGQPLWQSHAPLVVALDLSSATLASDMPPSRLAQARAKLSTLLRERQGGQVGLVVFAGDAFTVAPLTDDAANVALFLDSLQPDVMPRDGQRAAQAVAWSSELLRRAGANRGDILLITDHADDGAVSAAADAAAAGYRVSALGLGSEAGAAYRRLDSGIAKAHLDPASLRRLADSGHGRYRALASDDSDLDALGLLDPGRAEATGKGASALAWRDEGYWLLLPLMALMLFAFRRSSGALLVVVVLCGAWPVSGAHAADLWRRPDQSAHARVQEGNAAYRRGDFQAAERQYADVDSATAHYNRGNALAQAGRYPQAIEAYDRALKQQPGMADAIANRRAVQAAMKRQQQSGGKGGQSKQSQGTQGPGQQGQQQGQANQKPGEGQQNGAGDRQSTAQQGRNPDQKKQQASQSADPSAQATPDAATQAEADRAQRERMQRALQQQRDAQAGKGDKKAKAPVEETPEQRERRLANEAWLRRIPDDPGGLLRAKFRLEYERRVAKGAVEP